MVVPLFTCRSTIPRNRFNLWRELRTCFVVEVDSAALQVGKVAVAQEDDLVRVLKDGDGVGGEELLPFAEPDGKRRFTTGSNDSTWFAAMHHHERPLPVQAWKDGRNRKANVALVGIFDEVRDYFSVNVAGEGVPFRCQFPL